MKNHWAIFGLIMGLLGALGFEWAGPTGKRLAALEERTSVRLSRVEARVDSLAISQREILENSRLLIAGRCTEVSNEIARIALKCPAQRGR